MAKEKRKKSSGKKRINKKHFVIFNNGGIISATTPKDWARGNQHFFPGHDFLDSDNTPTVDQVEQLLTEIGYSNVSNNEILIYYFYKGL